MKRSLLNVKAAKRPRSQRKTLAELDAKRLALNKLIAQQRAEALGHVLGPWHRRPNDQLNRANAFCLDCNMIAVAGVAPLDTVAEILEVYGHAVTKGCKR